MSKRSFDEFAKVEHFNSVYHSALDNANKLLEAAQSLKHDLDRLSKESHFTSHERLLLTLKRHNAQISPVTRALCQAETADPSGPTENVPEAPNKVQKVGDGRPHSTGDSSARSPFGPGVTVPHPVMLTKWTPEDIPKTAVLPPLPPVLDPVLEKASRTHSGMATALGEMSYEKLEWIGDAYLYLMSSAFITQTFPNLPTGRCSQLRERLIKNDALSEFTVGYGIDKRARLPSEFQPGGRLAAGGTSASMKERKKILGDLFEAYVAAAILGDAGGLERVAVWIKPLWSTTLKHEICLEHKASTATQGPGNGVKAQESNGSDTNGVQSAIQKKSPKVALSQAIGAKTVTITYQDVGAPKKDKNTGLPWFTVGAYYDGFGERNLLLGYGSGLSKKEAGAEAAAKALENKKLIKRLQKLKEDMSELLGKSELT
ncbi:ribonuclease III [Xylariaceae sp. FL0594]|nr:ribonuclease III [Xylariaceae sp. FL0594]